MNRRLLLFAGLGALCLGALGVAVHAQTSPRGRLGSHGHGLYNVMGFGRGGASTTDHLARLDEHLGDVKALLRITPDQEADWTTFTTDIKTRATRIAAQDDAARSENEDIKAPERLARFATRLKSHEADLDGAIESFTRLYSALNPEQQSLLDRLVAHRGHGPWRG